MRTCAAALSPLTPRAPLAHASASSEWRALHPQHAQLLVQRRAGACVRRQRPSAELGIPLAARPGGAKFIGASAGRLAVVKFLAAMNPAADVMALANLEVDIGNLTPGNAICVKWRGKPVFIRSRTPEEIEQAQAVDVKELRDPESDADRVQKEETLVVLGVCTHLGCVPINGAGDFNGWFCPCHGSHYDTAGRIRKGPAPLNLEVPPYAFLSDSKIVVG